MSRCCYFYLIHNRVRAASENQYKSVLNSVYQESVAAPPWFFTPCQAKGEALFHTAASTKSLACWKAPESRRHRRSQLLAKGCFKSSFSALQAGAEEGNLSPWWRGSKVLLNTVGCFFLFLLYFKKKERKKKDAATVNLTKPHTVHLFSGYTMLSSPALLKGTSKPFFFFPLGKMLPRVIWG